MIRVIKSRQRKGKTTLAVGIARDLVDVEGYRLEDITADFHLYRPDGTELPGYKYVTIPQMRAEIRKMVHSKSRRKIYLIDETDRVFSHLFSQRKEDVEALLGLWQDEKLEHQIICTAHIGKSINKIIRQSMAKEYIVKGIDWARDRLIYKWIDVWNHETGNGWMGDVSLIQTLFRTGEPVVYEA